MNTRKEPAMATTPESFVDALNAAFGKQTTQRSAHAKGVVLLGRFVPSAEAASVSKALHFKHEVPVMVCFSANSGMAKIADADPRADPRGLAIRFRLPDGSTRHPFVQRLSGEEPRGVSAILPGDCRQQARGPVADANRGLPGDAPSREWTRRTPRGVSRVSTCRPAGQLPGSIHARRQMRAAPHLL